MLEANCKAISNDVNILVEDAQALFQDLGLSAHLTRQRTNGVRSMVERIQGEARRAMARVA